MNSKIEALNTHLGLIEDEGNNRFSVEGDTYLVLTEAEADAAAKAVILESLWSRKPEFLLTHMSTDITPGVLRAVQDKGEEANPLIRELIWDIEALVQDAIGTDGREHFLASYDGVENEVGDFFVYQVD